MWNNRQSSYRRQIHRKHIKRKYNYDFTHTPVRNIVLNLENIAQRKLTKMPMNIEGKECQVLLDSCSSTNIVSESILINHLNISKNNIYGPIGCIKGVGKAITYDLGRIQLKIQVLNRQYIEEFVVIREPGIPGEVLLSAEAMGRCGIKIDFRNRKILLADCDHHEVTFCLNETSYPVNRAHLHETGTSKQASTVSNKCNSSNSNSNKALELNKKNSALVENNKESNRHINVVITDDLNVMVPNPTESQKLVDIQSDDSDSNKINNYEQNNNNSMIASLMQEIHGKRKMQIVRNELSLVAQLMEEVHTENRNNKQDLISSIEQKIINAECQSGATDIDTDTNTNIKANTNTIKNACIYEENNEVGETYLIDDISNTKTVSEVLYLGKIDKQYFTEKIDEFVDGNRTSEYVCTTVTDNTELHCVSTNDDNKIKFSSVREICLMPNEYTKVYLKSVVDSYKVDDKEVILISDGLLQDGLLMEDNINKLKGLTCETFIYNNSDKRLTLNAGQIVCSGIILNNQMLDIKSEAFCCLTSVEESMIETEIGDLQFPQGKEELLSILTKYRDVLAFDGDTLGRTDVVTHKIVLEENAKQFFIPNYRLPISQRQVVEEMIETMKKDGVVRPSKSPYNSPLLLVPKKDGKWRMVIDYRQLNKQTVPERFPMPVINDVLAQLGGAKVFTSLDLVSGYWQIPLEESSKKFTAFSTHREHLEFEVLPFGLMNAPLAFSRAMMQVLGDLKNVFVYIDDIIIFSESLEEHFKLLREVLDRFYKTGLKIKVKKCQFLMSELYYLGHKLNEEGVKMQEGKVKAILEYPAPKTLKALRRFLGMIGYYRPFIQNFASKAYPLTNLLKNENKYEWEEEQQQSFETLKNCMMKDPILVYPDFKKEFFLACDASGTGLGAVLLQKNKCRMRVITYGSRVLNATEKNYSTTEKECLAVFWGLKKFRHLILGYKVNILTDHKPLLDLFKRRDFISNQKFNRWFLAVLEYGPNFRYIPGPSNTLADGLSRAFEEEEKNKIMEMHCFCCQSIDLDMEKICEEQQKDPEIRKIMADLLLNENSNSDFQFIDGIIYKRPRREQEVARLYIPKTLVHEILKLVHSHKLAGHPGISKSTQIVTRNYFWPHCSKDMEMYIRQCITCNKHKGKVVIPAPLEKYPTELYPFQVVAMDFVGPFPTTLKGNKQLLVFIDHLSRYVEIVPVRDRLASTVAEALKSRIIVRHSCPEILLSDNAAEFVSEMLNKLCEFYNIKKIQITPYKPSSNGAVERANGKIKNILRTIITPDVADWDTYIEDVQLVINNSINVTTGESPHFLLYGYEKRLPVSLLDNVRPPNRIYNYDDYIAQRLHNYYKVTKKTREMLCKGQEKNEKYYKSKEKSEIKLGTKVFVLQMVSEGPNVKISPKFEGPYRVIEILKTNKYKVIDKNCKEKIVHYNHLKIVKGDSNWSNPCSLQDEDVRSNVDVVGPYKLRPR